MQEKLIIGVGIGAGLVMLIYYIADAAIYRRRRRRLQAAKKTQSTPPPRPRIDAEPTYQLTGFEQRIRNDERNKLQGALTGLEDEIHQQKLLLAAQTAYPPYMPRSKRKREREDRPS